MSIILGDGTWIRRRVFVCNSHRSNETTAGRCPSMFLFWPNKTKANETLFEEKTRRCSRVFKILLERTISCCFEINCALLVPLLYFLPTLYRVKMLGIRNRIPWASIYANHRNVQMHTYVDICITIRRSRVPQWRQCLFIYFLIWRLNASLVFFKTFVVRERRQPVLSHPTDAVKKRGWEERNRSWAISKRNSPRPLNHILIFATDSRLFILSIRVGHWIKSLIIYQRSE